MTSTANLTLEEFLALPETKPGCEYLNGRLMQKATPNVLHGIIQSLLGRVLGAYIQLHRLGISGSEIRCIFGPPGVEPRVVLPDYLFLAREHLAGLDLNGPIRRPPDLAAEILSPDDQLSDVHEKLDFYLANGVRLVWVIDPQRRTLTATAGVGQAMTLAEGEAVNGGEVLPGFACAVADLMPSADGL